MKKFFIALLEPLQNVKIYLIVLGLALIASWITYGQIQTLPKPETLWELGKFYFSNPGGYLKISLFCLIAAFMTFIVGIATIINAVIMSDHFVRYLCIIVGIIGLAFIILGFYFLGYFGTLIVVLAIIGAIAFIAIKYSSNSR